MLNSHFVVKTDSIANKDNIIFYHDYRICILKKEVIRIERSKEKEFLDYPTKAIWFRNFGKIDFISNIKEKGIEIIIDDLVYYIADEFTDSYVEINEKIVALDNKENLLGTFEGLDGCDGDVNDHYANPPKPIVLGNGVCSKNGVAVLDDSNTQYLDNDGIFKDLRKNRFDVYIFAFNHKYQEAVKAFYELSSSVPLIPRFALGNWWSRYYAYKNQEYIDLMDKFIEKKIPITVSTIDTDWHPSDDIVEYYSIDKLDRMKLEYGFDVSQDKWRWGWTGYSWNLSLFKNPKKFLKELHKRNLKVCLNLHPDTICWYENEYETFAKNMNVDPKTLSPIKLDFKNPQFINAYYNDLHKNLEHEGVDFWWIDDNNSLFDLSHFYYLDNSKEKQPLILCRYPGVGSHRYPLGFSGDTVISWKSLNYLPYFTATASNIGYSWWSHDIGGFMAGQKNDELYLRYVQFGVFAPIMRLHCQRNEALTKEPWAYKNGIGDLAVNQLRLRHRLIPYIYSASYKNHKDNIALIEPMYYYYPENEEAYKYKNQYIFNSDLLVAPITSPSKNNISVMKVYVPEGTWTDIFTGDVYNGGKVINMVRTLDSIPVLAKEGSIIVLSNDDNGNSIDNPKELEIDVFNGESSFVLYEDNELNQQSFTHFETSNDGKMQYLSIMFEDNGAIPKNRTMRIKFKNIHKGEVYCNINANVKNNDCLEVIIKNVNTSAMIELQVAYNKESSLDILKRQAKQSIMFFEGNNEERVNLFNNLMGAKNKKEFLQIVNKAKINKYYKYRLKECK